MGCLHVRSMERDELLAERCRCVSPNAVVRRRAPAQLKRSAQIVSRKLCNQQAIKPLGTSFRMRQRHGTRNAMQWCVAMERSFPSFALPLVAPLLLSACGSSLDADSVSRNYDVLRYDLDAEYNWQRSRLEASVRITLTPTEDDLEAIEFDSGVEIKAVRIEGEGDVEFLVQPEKRLWVSLTDADVKKGKPIVVSIDYEAAPSDHLRPIGERNGDPLTIRALHTDSEPLGAQDWMPVHEDPSDRAYFSVRIRMDAKESLLANGTLTSDEQAGSSRTMRYETAYPLPAYLMAFAVSEFEAESTKLNELPIEVWHRKGLPGDYTTMLSELSRMVDEMQQLVGPYPFERYALVLLPGHMSGGMENAGITFQDETRSTALTLSKDARLTAHEVAHQWFGDLVTMRTYDDVWFKEGLATLFEHELQRKYTDTTHSGTLNGDNFYVFDGSAIWDPDKPPQDKYDSGIYSRSAWFFTQIRHVMGDDAFFATLRGLLDEHRIGSMGLDDIIRAFGPVFGSSGPEKLRRALKAKALPQLDYSSADQTVTLHDPEGALLVPVEFEWIASNGMRRREKLVLEQPVKMVPASADELLVLDPDDVHPDWGYFNYDGDWTILLDVKIPQTAETFATFLTLPGVHQTAQLWRTSEAWPISPTNLGEVVNNLHSEEARMWAIGAACEAARSTNDPNWIEPITTAITTSLTPYALDSTTSTFCSGIIDFGALWTDDWQKLANGLPDAIISDERLTFLSRFDGDHTSVWPEVLEHAGSLRARTLAMQRLRTKTEDHDRYVEMVRSIDASEILKAPAFVKLGNTTRTWKEQWEASLSSPPYEEDLAAKRHFEDGLAAFGAVLKKDVTRPAHRGAICTVRNLLREWVGATCGVAGCTDAHEFFDQDRWDAFVADLKGAPLSEDALAIAKDPSRCGD